MNDSFTETTSKSWFTRIKESIGGILFGLLLFFGAFPLLFWNEGNAVDVAKSLEEGASSVISIETTTPDTANDSKLIHLTGEVSTTETLTDEEFAITEPAIKLRRKIEMYQWTEKSESKTDKKLGGREETTTTYTYVKDWQPEVVDSSKFKRQKGHTNPSNTDFKGEEMSVSAASVGEFELTPSLIGKISNFETLPFTEVPPALQEKYEDKVLVQNGTLYIGKNPAQPEIGDQRITFEIVRPGKVSIVAKQDGSTLRPFKTSNGKTIELLSTGNVSAEEMFDAAQAANTTQLWILRVVGFVMMLLGLNMVFKVLSVIGSVVPFLGELISLGTGLVAFLIAFATSLIVIAISWIAARPILGISLLAIGVGALAYLGYIKHQKAPHKKAKAKA